MKPESLTVPVDGPFVSVARYGEAYRKGARPIHPTADTDALRQAFCVPLPEAPTPADEVIASLIAAAEPGLVGNTDPNFFAWVMGGSSLVGVTADMLTSIWGQNAAIYQTAPAAAIAEEAVSAWLLDLLDLPRRASVGFVTGATMASFVGLAAARSDVLRRAGHDYEADGLQGAPRVRVFLSDDAHIANFVSLRYLGFGDANVCRIPSDELGLMSPEALRAAMAEFHGPKIVVAQAGHINSGSFEDFVAIADISRGHNAWLHVDGAFGLWARVLPEKAPLTDGLELADSWSVDGHKWLQIPYDSGFAIVRNAEAHRRAMGNAAGYLNLLATDGRNPSDHNPELSRRARGFAAWAVLRSLGAEGVRALVAGHCRAATRAASQLSDLPGLALARLPDLNQIVLQPLEPCRDGESLTDRLAAELNAMHGVFVRPADWKGRRVLRLSFVTGGTGQAEADALAAAIRAAWARIHPSSPGRIHR
ncbi:MAG: pyridoxal-dependent decarboxylase [Pseudomonadota bacterium]